MSRDAAVCKVLVIHQDRVKLAERKMPGEALINEISDFFKTLGDPTRIRIINALSSSEMCVCDLTSVLDMNQPAVSHQLRILRQAGFVKFRKEGKIVYYSLSDQHVQQIYEQGLLHVKEKKGGRA